MIFKEGRLFVAGVEDSLFSWLLAGVETFLPSFVYSMQGGAPTQGEHFV